MLRALRPWTRPLLRPFCNEVGEEGKVLVQRVLEAASRPKMGKARANQSAGQRGLDLSKQAKNLEDLDLPALLRLDGTALKARNFPVQERKRLLKFVAKANQPGYTLTGRTWRSWREPRDSRLPDEGSHER